MPDWELFSWHCPLSNRNDFGNFFSDFRSLRFRHLRKCLRSSTMGKLMGRTRMDRLYQSSVAASDIHWELLSRDISLSKRRSSLDWDDDFGNFFCGFRSFQSFKKGSSFRKDHDSLFWTIARLTSKYAFFSPRQRAYPSNNTSIRTDNHVSMIHHSNCFHVLSWKLQSTRFMFQANWPQSCKGFIFWTSYSRRMRKTIIWDCSPYLKLSYVLWCGISRSDERLRIEPAQAQPSEKLVSHRPEEFGFVNCVSIPFTIEIHSKMSLLDNVLWGEAMRKRLDHASNRIWTVHNYRQTWKRQW
jgi:hypothetical protein